MGKTFTVSTHTHTSPTTLNSVSTTTCTTSTPGLSGLASLKFLKRRMYKQLNVWRLMDTNPSKCLGPTWSVSWMPTAARCGDRVRVGVGYTDLSPFTSGVGCWGVGVGCWGRADHQRPNPPLPPKHTHARAPLGLHCQRVGRRRDRTAARGGAGVRGRCVRGVRGMRAGDRGGGARLGGGAT